MAIPRCARWDRGIARQQGLYFSQAACGRTESPVAGLRPQAATSAFSHAMVSGLQNKSALAIRQNPADQTSARRCVQFLHRGQAAGPPASESASPMAWICRASVGWLPPIAPAIVPRAPWT
jgi:hypothetical protein